MDGAGNLAIDYSASSSSINPQIRYSDRLAVDPLNTLPQSEATLVAGTGSQSGNGNRWDDYSAMTIDPVDDSTFWYTSEYLTATGGSWQTRIANFRFVNGPVVTSGGAAAFTGENFTPPNGASDPGEFVTVSLPLINTGTGNTTNLVGTLQATGGVTSPSGPQTYGIVVAGGAVGLPLIQFHRLRHVWKQHYSNAYPPGWGDKPRHRHLYLAPWHCQHEHTNVLKSGSHHDSGQRNWRDHRGTSHSVSVEYRRVWPNEYSDEGDRHA